MLNWLKYDLNNWTTISLDGKEVHECLNYVKTTFFIYTHYHWRFKIYGAFYSIVMKGFHPKLHEKTTIESLQNSNTSSICINVLITRHIQTIQVNLLFIRLRSHVFKLSDNNTHIQAYILIKTGLVHTSIY